MVYLEESIRYPAHTGLFLHLSVCLSVCPSVMNTKTSRFLTFELKLGCPHGVICLSSIASKYLFLCARRKFGLNKKIRRILLIVYVYYQPNSCTTHTEHEWAGGIFLRQQKKVPPAHTQWVILEPAFDGQHSYRVQLVSIVKKNICF
jgi:hypothetical protein